MRSNPVGLIGKSRKTGDNMSNHLRNTTLVVNEPNSLKGSPRVSWPSRNQVIPCPPPKAGFGVQVSTVFAALQEGVVLTNPPAVGSKNSAAVAAVSMGLLKVKTTGDVGVTPIAPSVGTTEKSEGCAWTWTIAIKHRIDATKPQEEKRKHSNKVFMKGRKLSGG